jgi:hypothetical protein
LTTIKCLVWNAQSLNNKVDECTQLLYDNQVDIAFITETWLSDEGSVTTFAIKEAGYKIDHAYRSKRGGGVAILWKSSLKVKCNSRNKIYQSLQFKNIIIVGNVNINCICIYRLQEVPVSQFMDDLNDLLSFYCCLSETVILTGDFNFWYEISDSKYVRELADLTSSYGLSQFVTGPSHKMGHTLDLVFANRYEFDLPLLQPLNLDISDHFPILFELPSFNHLNKISSKQFSYRNIKSVDRIGFSHNFRTALDNKIQSVDIANIDFSNHYKIFSDCAAEELDKVAPVITRSLSGTSQPPWMDTEYRQERVLRRTFERIWKASGTTEDKGSYITQRKKCAQLATSKRKEYFSRIISKCEGDTHALFNIVTTVLDKRKTSGILPQFENPKALANKFNNFYSNKVLQIRNKIKPSDLECDFRKKFSGTVMECLMPTTVEELRSIIKEMGIKTSCQDPMPCTIFKDIIEDLLPYICDLVNKSLNTGSVEGIKDCVIVPLLKKMGIDPDTLKNYRPVTNEVFISKLTEKVVSMRMFKHMNVNNLHSKYQHAYKKFHGTETLLVKLVDDVLIGFESNSATIVLLIDLSAAFDTVDIDKLLNILENDIGIRGTALIWFESFLRGRTQCVKIENFLSDTLPVLFGVPQGSVLGPILFNIYASSLSLVIRNFGFNTSGYADDNNAYNSFALSFQYNIIAKQLPDLLNQIHEWMNLFFLKMNPDKTEIIMFIPQQLKDAHTINGCIFTDGSCIRFVNFVKNLGVLLDRHLNMDVHINAIVSVCYKQLSDIGKIRKLLSKKDTELLVHAVISSRLDYCNSLLYGANKTHINKLQMVQNAAARLVSMRRKHESVSDVLVNLHWLRIEARIIYKLLVLVYKCIYNIAPECIIECISIKDGGRCLLAHKFFQSSQARKSFSYIAPKLWNNLPDNIRFSSTLLKFKNHTKYLLFNKFNDYMKSVHKYN